MRCASSGAGAGRSVPTQPYERLQLHCRVSSFNSSKPTLPVRMWVPNRPFALP